MAEVVKGIIDVEINTGSAAAELKILQQQINSVFLTLNKNNATSAAASQKFAANLLDAVNASRVFTGEQVKMRTAAGALDDTLRKGQATLAQYFSAKYVKNGALFAETLDLSRKRAALLQTQFIATGAASKGMQDAIAIRPLQAFSTQAAIAAQRTQLLSSMFRQGTTQLINFGKNVQWAGRQLMVGFTVPLTIFGATAGRVFRDLEKEVVAFKKVYGDLFTTPQELETNLEAVRELSREFTKYGIAVKDTMGLAAQAAAAGRRNSELTDAVTQATRLATLGQMEQNQALETTIALQSAFKLSGQELADSINFLNMVENQTVVSLQDLSAAIPRVAPVIQGLGGDVKDLSVFLAAMQEGGVSAEQGANALKSGLASLINPTKNATETLAGFGIGLDNIIQKNRGDLMGVVMDFGKALQTLDEFSRQQALEEVFGKFQYARLGALFENIVRDGSQASQVMQTMGYTTQELAATAEKELKTVADSFGVQLQGAIERFKLAIAPIGEIFVKLAIPIVNFVTKIAEAFNNLPDFTKTFLAFAAIITGLVIPAGTMFFGLLMNLTGTFAKLIQFMGAFGKGFTQGGIIGAFKNATQSARYFSNSEIEAALAAQQLGTAAEYTNSALREQITQAMGAAGAVRYLSDSYTILVAKMMEASKLAPYTMGVGERASDLAKSGRSASGRLIRPPQMRNAGGRIFMSDGSTVPGTGNTDTVPAMLTPGEFVVNKQATKENLGLLYAINGGGAGFNKGGILNAVKGKYITPADAARTSQEELSVFLLKNMSKAKRTIAAKAAPGEILNKLNNFVYLFEPNTNQQLIGSKTMKGYDKRGVPGNQLINEMLTDDALWMIDAYAQGKWAKAAYKQTLQDNYNNLISKYPGKEIRFVDHKGLERVKSLSGTPGYENVQFLSVRQLHDKNLYNRLSPDHLTRLLSLDTANQMQSRLRSSTGKIEPRSTYVDINSGSYTKLQKSWRGTKRPAGKQGSHFNTGGLLMANNGAFVSKNFAYDTTALSGADAKAFNTKMNQLYDYFRKNNIDRSSLPLYMQSDHVPLNSSHAKEFLQFLVKNKVPTGQFADVYSFLMNAIKNPSVYHRRILEGFMTSEIGHLTKSKNIKYGEAEKTSRKNLFSALSVTGPRITNMEDALFALENLDSFTASEFLSKRIRQGKIVKVPLGRGYGEAKRSAAGIPIRGRVRLHATTPSQITRILGVTRNNGGIIPGVNYLNMGGLGKAIFERSKVGKPRIKNLSGLDANSMNLIDELAPFIGADAAVDYAKILQKGSITVDIGQFFKKAKSLEDIVQDRYSEWKSQNQWAVYSPGYQDVRDRALSKIRKQVTDQEFKRMSTGRPSLIEDYNKNLDEILRYPGYYNKGGMAKVAKYNKGNIVPGSGNTDTVPAMLTPGEFVVNKSATRNNLALLKAINNGSMSGYNKGGGVAQSGKMFYGPIQDRKTANALRRLEERYGLAQPRQGFMERNPMAAMGLMSAGFTLPMIGTQMQESSNKFAQSIGGFVSTISPAVMALSIFPQLLNKITTPWGLLIAGVVAVGIGLKKYRESIDKASRESAKQGASAGGAANALDTMASILQQQTPLQQVMANSIKFTEKQLIAQEQAYAALQTEQGQAFVKEIQGLTSDKRVSQLTSYIQTAIASGMMDRTGGAEFARVVAQQIGDTLLGPQVIRQVMSQQAGSSALLSIAQQRSGYRQFTPTQQTAGGFVNVSGVRVSAGTNYQTYGVGGGGMGFKDAAYNIGLAIQSFKSAAEVQALANLELQRGAISQAQYNDTIAQSTKLQLEAQNQMQIAIQNTSDKGGTAQAIKDQLTLAGFTPEQIGVIESNVKKITDPNKAVQLQLQIASGQINPQDLPVFVEFLTNKNNKVAIDWTNSFAGSEISAAKFAMWAANNLTESGSSQFRMAIQTVGLDRAPELQRLISIWGEKSAVVRQFYIDIQGAGANPDQTLKEFSNLYENLGSKDKSKVKEATLKLITLEGGNESTLSKIMNQIKNFNDMSIESKVAIVQLVIATSETGLLSSEKARADMTGKTATLRQEALDKIKSLQDEFKKAFGAEGGTGEKSQIQLMLDAAKATEQYNKALVKLGKDGVLSLDQLSQIDEKLAIELANVSVKKRIEYEKTLKTMLENRQNMEYRLMSEEEKQLKRMDLQDKIYSRQIQLIDRRIDLKQKDIQVENDANEKRQRALNEISKKEDIVNQAYETRLNALDDIDRATQRNANRERSRIDLASALASGDIAAAARTASEINQQESQYKIEDARTSLEKQRQTEVAAIATEVNGIMMTRAQIEDAIALSDEKIYGIQQQIKKIEEEKIPIMQLQQEIADKRYATELNILETMVKQMNQAGTLSTTAAAPGVSTTPNVSTNNNRTSPTITTTLSPTASSLKTAVSTILKTPAVQQTVSANTLSSARYTAMAAAQYAKPSSLTTKMYSGSGIYGSAKRYFGGLMSRGSKESPPALKMAYGNIVPGMGNSDKVPALLTPGEFVIRKSVASAYMPLLETLNNQTYPGAMPRGTAQNSSNMYNTYSVNVNVAGTDASPEEIANAVMSKIKAVESRSLRSVKVV